MTRRLLYAAPVLALALVGCSGSKATPTAAATTQAASAAPATSAAPGSSTAAASPAVAVAPAATHNLQAQMLALTDMPAGWSVDTSSDSSSSGPSCFGTAKGFKSGSTEHADVTYQDGTNGVPSLDESAGYFPTNATGAVAEAVKVFSGCGTISFKSGGDTFKGTLGAMNIPAAGDESDAYQLSLSTTDSGVNVTIGFDLDIVRVGHEVALLVYDDLGTPDIDQFQTFVKQSVAKLAES